MDSEGSEPSTHIQRCEEHLMSYFAAGRLRLLQPIRLLRRTNMRAVIDLVSR
jgi:hypothetical protein